MEGERPEQRAREGADEQLAFDGDVDDTAALADDPGHGAENQRDRQQHGLLQQALQVQRRPALRSGAEPAHERKHERHDHPGADQAQAPPRKPAPT